MNGIGMPKRVAWFAALVVFASGCSSGDDQMGSPAESIPPTSIANTGATQTTPSVVSTTSTTTSTTIPKDPQEELTLLAFFNQATDVSQIVETNCGRFALLVLQDRITFHKWINNMWADNSEALGPDGRLIPKYVKSVDLTGDFVLDLFVQYEDPESSDPIGAVFLNEGCAWNWATFDDSGYVTDAFTGLSWSEQREMLTGSMENYDGYMVPFTVSFNQQSRMFAVEYLPFEPPPPACVSAFNLISRKNYSKVLYSWFYGVHEDDDGPYFTRADWDNNHRKGSSVSLAKCRRQDWIVEANRRRTEYTNHVDAMYYGARYVLLANENAASILKELCTLKIYFGGTLEKYAFREDQSIACEGY